MQRDIHEKREARKAKIATLRLKIDINDVMFQRLRAIIADVESEGRSQYSAIVERLKTEPSPDKPPTGADNQPTYDQMVLALLLTILDEVKEKGIERDTPEMDQALVDALRLHLGKLEEEQAKVKAELQQEEKERQKKITSEDIHEGWDSKVDIFFTVDKGCIQVCAFASTSHQNPNQRPLSRQRRLQRRCSLRL
jgi:cell division cycle protein 37